VNVIPGKASAVFDGRLIPGQTKDDFLAEIRAVIGDGFAIEVLNWFPGRENDVVYGDPLYEAIAANVRRTDPSGVPIPYMIPGFTDAQYFGRLGARCFGYAPVRFPAEDRIAFNTLVHGHDERIHVEGFRWGVDAFVDLVTEFVGVA
jgi:acetylornithine deacetylase/succinyl-diaminopimelate desuccinylase-like protein